MARRRQGAARETPRGGETAGRRETAVRQKPALDRVDRRVVRTRQLLRDAVIALTLERGFESITVQDVLDRANLGRSTFYAHFRNKEDLMLSGFELFLAELHADRSGAWGGAGADFSLEGFSHQMFRHVAQNRRLLKAQLGRRGDQAIHRRVQLTLDQALCRQLERLAGKPGEHGEPPRPSVPLAVAAHFYASSLLALLTLWLDRDLPYPAEQMDAMFKQLALPGLLAALDAGGA